VWKIKIKKSEEKGLLKLPVPVRALFADLKSDLEYLGPVQTSWPNYSKLGGGRHHCHLNYRYVACWKETNETITIEVYYVGSREGAPY